MTECTPQHKTSGRILRQLSLCSLLLKSCILSQHRENKHFEGTVNKWSFDIMMRKYITYTFRFNYLDV